MEVSIITTTTLNFSENLLLLIVSVSVGVITLVHNKDKSKKQPVVSIVGVVKTASAGGLVPFRDSHQDQGDTESFMITIIWLCLTLCDSLLVRETRLRGVSLSKLIESLLLSRVS